MLRWVLEPLRGWLWIALLWIVLLGCLAGGAAAQESRRLLYVVAPGIRNYLEFGGAGILVFDIDAGHRFVKRLETTASRVAAPENIKGVCANAASRRLYFTTPTKLYAFDLVREQTVWEKALPQGCDRMSITPDGTRIYVPSFEKDTWNVVDADQGELVKSIVTKSGAHNTVCGLNGKRMYLAGLRSPLLSVADTATHEVIATVGPFSAAIRPFTVDGNQSRCYVCINELLGFEIGDLATGRKLARVEVEGFPRGPVKRHGCPSHGIGLTPDEQEIWLCDAHNSRLHVFDNRVFPPRQTVSISLREQPGWVTFSLDGRYAYPSTGEVIDTATKKIVAALTDEMGRGVHSEKMIEIHFAAGLPTRTGDQFGLGRVVAPDPGAGAPLLDEAFGVRKVADNCLFTEGPVVDLSGTLYFSDGRNNRIMQRTSDGRVSEFRKPSGRPNGLTIDHEGRLLMCQSSGEGGGRRVTRLEKDGTETVLAAVYDGRPFNAPNDLCVDPRGRVYFTDPNFGPAADAAQPVAGVYRIDAPGQVTLVIKNLQRPNGIAITRDGRQLYVSDRGTQKLHRYRVTEEEGVQPDGIVYDFAPDRGIDGMRLDEQGNIWAAAGQDRTTGLFVVSPSGKLLLHRPMPEFSTNLAFGGPDRRDLFFTATTSVYQMRTTVAGLPTPTSR